MKSSRSSLRDEFSECKRDQLSGQLTWYLFIWVVCLSRAYYFCPTHCWSSIECHARKSQRAAPKYLMLAKHQSFHEKVVLLKNSILNFFDQNKQIFYDLVVESLKTLIKLTLEQQRNFWGGGKAQR